MRGFRTHIPSEIAGFKVVEIIDRLPEEKRLGSAYKVGATGDQLSFVLSTDHKSKITVRPSGTEPKVKYYIQHYGKVSNNLSQVREKTDLEAAMVANALEDYGLQFIK